MAFFGQTLQFLSTLKILFLSKINILHIFDRFEDHRKEKHRHTLRKKICSLNKNFL